MSSSPFLLQNRAQRGSPAQIKALHPAAAMVAMRSQRTVTAGLSRRSFHRQGTGVHFQIMPLETNLQGTVEPAFHGDPGIAQAGTNLIALDLPQLAGETQSIVVADMAPFLTGKNRVQQVGRQQRTVRIVRTGRYAGEAPLPQRKIDLLEILVGCCQRADASFAQAFD